MTRYAAVPMNPAQWRQALADLARKAGEANAEDQADFLRIARTLMTVAPASEAWRFGDLPSRSGFERLLAAEAWESAALALLPETMVSRLTSLGSSPLRFCIEAQTRRSRSVTRTPEPQRPGFGLSDGC